MKKFFSFWMCLLLALPMVFVSCSSDDDDDTPTPNAEGGGNYKGHEYVDLGLPSGTLWATCNVGATKPEEYGEYFAWGETESKSFYSKDSYKWYDPTYSAILKYCTDSYSGKVDNLVRLEPADDVAQAKWGGNWYMPSLMAMKELKELCTWEWTTENGVNGYKVTSSINQQSIFFPAAGYREDSVVTDVRYTGRYWSSSLDDDYDYDAYCLTEGYTNSIYRYYGASVRPVTGAGVFLTITKSLDKKFSITYESRMSITECGICYSVTNTNPSVSDDKIQGTIDGNLSGTYTVEIPSVDDRVYVRPYAIVNGKVYYGNVLTFGNKLIGGHRAVDLGLPSGTLWATCNVGATKPEEYGDYFAWGETEPKTTYSWSTYKWCNGSYDTMTKYCTESYYGTVDNKTTLDIEDDAAHVNWGGNWRMPTLEEQKELLNNCSWTWTTLNGVQGYEVKSKTNGNSIFLPAAGYRDGDYLGSVGSHGDCWSSSLYSSFSDYACYLGFSSDYYHWYRNGRYYGRTVRPVLSGQAQN